MLACSSEIKNNVLNIISDVPCNGFGDWCVYFNTYLFILLTILLRKKKKKKRNLKKCPGMFLLRLYKAILSHPWLGTRYLKPCPCCVLSLVPPDCTVQGRRKVALCWGLVRNGLRCLLPGLPLSSQTARESCCHRERLHHWTPCWSRWTICTHSERVMPQNLTNQDFWRRKRQRRCHNNVGGRR